MKEKNYEIKVKVRKPFGKEIIDPLDHNSNLFARMLHQDTLTPENINFIKLLGFKVNVEQPTLKL